MKVEVEVTLVGVEGVVGVASGEDFDAGGVRFSARNRITFNLS